MDLTNNLRFALCAALCCLLSACSVSYKFNGASIDYSKVKTIQIADFPIRSSYVWGPMGPIFNNALKDQFADHTKLSQVKRNGDLKLEGEIAKYEQRNKAVTADGISAQTELSMTVNVTSPTIRTTIRTSNSRSRHNNRTTPACRSTPYRKNSSHKWSRTSATRYSTKL